MRAGVFQLAEQRNADSGGRHQSTARSRHRQALAGTEFGKSPTWPPAGWSTIPGAEIDRRVPTGEVRALAAKLWHVVVTVGGKAMETSLVKAALERLSSEQPFLLSGRYGPDKAEVRYWEEAPECADAAALALRLWGEHRASAKLPAWHVLGVEVVEQEVFQRRGGEVAVSMVAPAGGWRPF